LKDVKRRRFIKKSLDFLPWLGAGALIYPASRLVVSGDKSFTKAKIFISDLTYEVTEIPGFFIIKTKDGYKAFSRSCTHLGCELKFDALKGLFACPCHKSEFDLDGKVLKGPAKENLYVANIKINNNEMEISL